MAILLAVALFAALLYLPSLGRGDFVGDDESLDAGVVWEMAHGGGWLFPEFNGEYLPPKPPLYYWAAGAVASARGAADEWALRLPAALSGVALATLTAAAGARFVGGGPAALAGVLLATTPIMRGEARIGRCDMLLALLATGALLLLARTSESPLGRGGRLAVWLLLGLAAICKGGAGVGLVVSVILADAVLERSVQPTRALLGPEIAVFVMIAVAWYGAATWHWGARFVDEQIIGENLNRLFGGEGISDKGSGTRSLLYHLTYYPTNLVLGTLPWSLALPAALTAWWRDPERRRTRFLAVWLGAGLVFFTLVSRKSPYYLLPLAPAVSLLVASWAFPRLREALAAEPLDIPFGKRGLAAVFGVAIVAWLGCAAAARGGCQLAALSEGLGSHPLTAVGGLSLALGGLLVAGGAVLRRRLGAAFYGTLAVVTGTFLIVDRVEGPLDDCVSLQPFAVEVRSLAGPAERLFFFELPLPAVALYAERHIATLRDPVREAPTYPFLLILPKSLEPRVPAEWLESSETLAVKRARVFTRRTMEIRLLRIRDPRALDGQREQGTLVQGQDTGAVIASRGESLTLWNSPR